jgi:hypothetical protein
MKRITSLLITAILSTLMLSFNSCLSINNGTILQNTQSSSKDNFTIVKTISGEATATYVLGIGGNNRNGLTKEAKEKMYSNHKLSSNQNITNITLDVQKQYFIIPILFNNETVIVSADVIEYYENTIRTSNNSLPNIDAQQIQNSTPEKKDEYSDTTKYRSIKSISEITRGSEIIVINTKGIAIEGIVTRIKKDEKIEFAYQMNNGDLVYDEAYIGSIRIKIK